MPYEVLVRLTNRDVLVGDSDRPAAQIIESTEPLTLTAASYVKRRSLSTTGEQNGDAHYNEINISRESIAFAIDL